MPSKNQYSNIVSVLPWAVLSWPVRHTQRSALCWSAGGPSQSATPGCCLVPSQTPLSGWWSAERTEWDIQANMIPCFSLSCFSLSFYIYIFINTTYGRMEQQNKNGLMEGKSAVILDPNALSCITDSCKPRSSKTMLPWVCVGWRPPSSAGYPIVCSHHAPYPWVGRRSRCGSPGPDDGTVCWWAPAGSGTPAPDAGRPATKKQNTQLKVWLYNKTPNYRWLIKSFL